MKKTFLTVALILSLLLSLCSCSEKVPSGKAGFTGTPTVYSDFISSVLFGLDESEWLSRTAGKSMKLSGDLKFSSSTGHDEFAVLPNAQVAGGFVPGSKLFFLNGLSGVGNFSFKSNDNGAQFSGNNGVYEISDAVSLSVFDSLRGIYARCIKRISELTHDAQYSDVSDCISVGGGESEVNEITLTMNADEYRTAISALTDEISADADALSNIAEAVNISRSLTGRGFVSEEDIAAALGAFAEGERKAGDDFVFTWKRYVYNGQIASERIVFSDYIFYYIYSEDKNSVEGRLSLTDADGNALINAEYIFVSGSFSDTYTLQITLPERADDGDDLVYVWNNEVKSAFQSGSFNIGLYIKEGNDTLSAAVLNINYSGSVDMRFYGDGYIKYGAQRNGFTFDIKAAVTESAFPDESFSLENNAVKTSLSGIFDAVGEAMPKLKAFITEGIY